MHSRPCYSHGHDYSAGEPLVWQVLNSGTHVGWCVELAATGFPTFRYPLNLT